MRPFPRCEEIPLRCNQARCGALFQIEPLLLPGIPPLGVNDSFTWWPGVSSKIRSSSSRRATKRKFVISWREVSTGGANLGVPRKLHSLATRIS